MPNRLLADDEIRRMRAAGVAVPETIVAIRKLLQEAESHPERIALDDAFREIRAQLLARNASKGA